jgi:hypothetical protein
LPAEAAKQRRLVGGSGIEPMTPSRIFLFLVHAK